MSSGHQQGNGFTSSFTSPSTLPPESPSPDDESLREENTLSACLLRILQSGHTSGEDLTDGLYSPDADQPEFSSDRTYRLARPLSPRNQVDCRRLNLPHCQRSAAAAAPVPKTPSPGEYPLLNTSLLITSDSMAENREGKGEGDKLKNWRAAGEALRKVLAETSVARGGGRQRDGEVKGKRECLKAGRGGCKRKDGGDASGGEAASMSDDPMNLMLDEYKAQEDSNADDPLNPKVTQSLLAGVESVIANSESSPAEALSQSPLTPGLVSVRERIQQITARINHNKGAEGSADAGARKGHSHKYNRTTGLLHTRSSSIGHGSSSESEDEVEAKRHKIFVPRCRRTSSSSKSTKGGAGLDEQLAAGIEPQKDKTSSSEKICSRNHKSQKGVNGEKVPGQMSSPTRLEAAENTFEQLSDIDSQEDFVTQKLQRLARQREANNCISESDDTSLNQFHPYGHHSCGRLLSAETDSMPNLADIESSLHSDENETLGESDLSELRFSERRLRAGITGAGSGKEGNDQDGADSGTAYPGWGSDADGNWSEQGTLKRNKEKTRSQAGKEADASKVNGAGSEGEELEELEDLVFNHSSQSDNENGPIEIPAEKLGGLPELVSDSSCASASDGDGEADDEFECDCPVCQQHKSRTGTEWVTDDEDDILEAAQRIEYYSDNSNQHPQVINLAELTPLDLLLMREGRRELLELMFQNVIMQMLSVYPDLLGEQAPPPAPATTIKDLPKIKVDSTHVVGGDFVCPICLCNFEIGEEARELPCHHRFHGLCIQAWLHKSGTCPVCRHILSSPR